MMIILSPLDVYAAGEILLLSPNAVAAVEGMFSIQQSHSSDLLSSSLIGLCCPSVRRTANSIL